jgi:hypothetical protein
LATEDLPDPLGPSMAITNFELLFDLDITPSLRVS